MKPAFFANGRFFFVLLTIGLTVGLVSWDHQRKQGHFQQPATDTIPEKKINREKKTRDLDDVIDELDRAAMEIDEHKIQKEVAEAMKGIDVEKIKLQIEKAMRQIDMEKIKLDVEASLAKVDFNKIKEEIAAALHEIDVEKIQQEVKASLQKVDWDELKAELEKVKEIDMDKLKIEIDKMKTEMKKIKPELEKAKIEIEKAKSAIKEYKSFIDGLNKDGLINKKEGYTLTHKNGVFEINGNKVSGEVYAKYRDFLEKHKTFSIKSDNDDFDINLD